MRKLRLVAALAVVGLAAAFPSSASHAQGYGMMGGYYGYGPGYGHGYMMGPGYGYGPGMMGYGYAYAPRGAYRRGEAYRGERLCWTSTDPDRGFGYYAPCQK